MILIPSNPIGGVGGGQPHFTSSNFAFFGCLNEVKWVQIASFYLVLPHPNFAFLAARMR